MVSAAKRAAYLSYYFDGGTFWDAERERQLFRDFYWNTNGLIALEAMMNSGAVRIAPRKASISAQYPNNRVEPTATIETPGRICDGALGTVCMKRKLSMKALLFRVSHFMEAKPFSCRCIFCGGLAEEVVVFVQTAF